MTKLGKQLWLNKVNNYRLLTCYYLTLAVVRSKEKAWRQLKG